MPNGGSDCCGTCWFNSKNDGEAGYHGAEKEGIAKCTIRDLDVPDPFWTYCANHPHHTGEKMDLPLGPVYITKGYPYYRKVWMQPPDNGKIRSKLLEVLDEINAVPLTRYPLSIDLEEEVIKQVASLKEKRALPKLLEIIQLDIEAYKAGVSPIFQNKAVIVGLAIEALLEITEGQYLEKVKRFIDYGLGSNYEQGKDGFAVIRYHLIRGLQYCKQPEADELLRKGINDPHSKVKAFAVEIYEKRTNRKELA